MFHERLRIFRMTCPTEVWAGGEWLVCGGILGFYGETGGLGFRNWKSALDFVCGANGLISRVGVRDATDL